MALGLFKSAQRGTSTRSIVQSNHNNDLQGNVKTKKVYTSCDFAQYLL